MLGWWKYLLEQLAGIPTWCSMPRLCTASQLPTHSSLASPSETADTLAALTMENSVGQISCISISHDWALPIDRQFSCDFGRPNHHAHAGEIGVAATKALSPS